MRQRTILGAVIIIFGLIMLLETLGIGGITIEYIISNYWAIIFMVIGLSILLGNSTHKFPGLIIFSIGALNQANSLLNRYADRDIDDFILPIIIIVIGAWFLLPRKKYDGDGTLNNDSFVKQIVLFSGAEITNESRNFQGADLFALFGGIDLDLKGADIKPGEKVKIDVFTGFGGTTIVVPEGWRVKVTGIPLFGGWSNKARRGDVESGIDLEISAFIAFGGLEIKN